MLVQPLRSNNSTFQQWRVSVNNKLQNLALLVNARCGTLILVDEPNNLPSAADLSVIRKFLPSLKQKMGGKSAKKRKVAGMISPQVCAICGKAYDDYKHKSVNCPPCDKNLKECCAFTTMDGRFAFMKLDGIWKDIFQAGEAISVSADEMSELADKKIPESWKAKFAEILKNEEPIEPV